MATPSAEVHADNSVFETFMRIFITGISYALVLIIVLGCIGNTLSCIIFFRQRKQDRASAQYLGVLAFVDMINLSIVGIPVWLLGGASVVSDVPWSFVYFVVNEYGCRAWSYTWHLFAYMSAWVVVLFSLERMLITWNPLKMSVYFSSDKPRKRAMGTLFTIAIVMFLGAFHWSGLQDVVDEHTTETFVRQGCFIRFDIPVWEIVIALFLTYGLGTGLPCILIAIFNVLILVGIRKNRFEKNKPSKKERKCTKNLIMVSTFFFLFMTPSTILIPVDVYYHLIGFPGYTEKDIARFHDWALLTQALNYCNFAVNPILYTFCLPFYREELKRLVCFGRSTQATKPDESDVTKSTAVE